MRGTTHRGHRVFTGSLIWVCVGVLLILGQLPAVHSQSTTPTGPAAPALSPPVLLVVIQETNIGYQGLSLRTAEGEVAKQLIASGYTVVEVPQSDLSQPPASGQQIANCQPGAPGQPVSGQPTNCNISQSIAQALGPSPVPGAQALAQQYHADVVIVGQAVSETAGPVGGGAPSTTSGGTGTSSTGMGLLSARARVQVRIILASGQIIASEAAAGSAVDIAGSIAAQTAETQAADLIATAVQQRLAAAGLTPRSGVPPAASAPLQGGVQAQQAPSPAAPSTGRMKIAVLPFAVGPIDPQWTQSWDVSGGVADLVEAELVSTKRFAVFERRQLNTVLNEQGLGLSGAVDNATAARVGHLVGVQTLITGTVNQLAVSGGGGVVNIQVPIGGVVMYQAQVELTGRAIDSTTGEILASTHGVGKASGFGGAVNYQGIVFGGAQFDKTVLGQAVHQAIHDLVANLQAALLKL